MTSYQPQKTLQTPYTHAIVHQYQVPSTPYATKVNTNSNPSIPTIAVLPPYSLLYKATCAYAQESQ
jgi:hypothetical protein